ncbi:glutamine synthetase [Clostridium botulinum]|uniref:Glutamine synthetase n=1 Tax=Clostridium botulinum TaxID=1491 RepID=A0A6B4JPP6_CLOBO|nr:glutamine synthetase [Clostridium botulinum]EES48494.1 glutamate--ammonia ligase [Clostridium botulinum E1 str. 'BoNT E Beluga']MBY6762386.1 glutamine synthetase [Clostridium botulinum]MBY6921229.1 glutamine synthetase [Clostridium botulinum]MCR1131914.1 glutamine synthetase [Clostridium botulinum]NFJ58889.1 glutamine synthetase [Clostridium botulinum]
MNNLLYVIKKENHNAKDLNAILNENSQIKFVSFVGIDLSGNDTDEKIPVKLFLENIDSYLNGIAVQTDGSSVVLPGIATLNNAKVDMITDLDSRWFVDYNFNFTDSETNKPVGTLRIPCFLYHDNKPVDSRHILKASVSTVKETLSHLFQDKPELLNIYDITPDDIDDIIVTSATELEFWVKTPNENAEVEELSTSQVLHEHYWTRTKGSVRTALEETLLLMEKYDFEPEMGHKEVGGVRAKLNSSGNFDHVMEQIEIDWKYSDALQAADNELFVRILTQETFRRNGLEVTFMAKPIEEVAGSGMHVHLSISLKLKNGKRINIFNGPKNHFLSVIGYGAIMGVLKNYEVMNPFISSTNNSLRRLKPGFEAPICIVTSLGKSPENPSRNRSILVGLIRDLDSPLATRFELRSPNPHTNTYIAMAVSFMSMLDGILYAVNKTEDELLAELSKKSGEDADYLEKERAYRSEEDVFEYFSEEERNKFFGIAPATIYENLSQLEQYPEKVEILKKNNVMTSDIINSFKLATLQRWTTEIIHRIINNYINEIRSFAPLHSLDKALDLDISNWMKINDLRMYIMKDTYTTKGLFTRIKIAFINKDYEKASELYIELEDKMKLLRDLYSSYRKNLLDI